MIISAKILENLYQRVSIPSTAWAGMSKSKVHPQEDLAQCGVLCDLDDECNTFRYDKIMKTCTPTYVSNEYARPYFMSFNICISPGLSLPAPARPGPQ